MAGGVVLTLFLTGVFDSDTDASSPAAAVWKVCFTDGEHDSSSGGDSGSSGSDSSHGSAATVPCPSTTTP